MPSSIDYLNYILEQLKYFEDVSFKKMMGEYLIYVNGVLVGGIYDDRLLIKKTKTNEEYHLKEELPYEGAKYMWLIDDVDNKETLIRLLTNAYSDLKQ